MPRCIYCESDGPFKNLEHPLPRCLGEFRDAPRLLDTICTDCNREIGRAEEQFCRAGPEAFFRAWFNVQGRSTHDQVNPFERGSAGAEAIDFVASHPESGLPILWEVNRGEQTIREVRQVVLIDDQGNVHQIRVRSWMTEPAHLRAEIDRLGITVSASRALQPEGSCGHAYMYFDEDDSGQFAGEATDLSALT